MTACKKTTQSISTTDVSYVTNTLQQAYFNIFIDRLFIIPLFGTTTYLQTCILIIKERRLSHFFRFV